MGTNGIVAFSLANRRSVAYAWLVVMLVASPLAARLPTVLRGTSDIPGSPSDQVAQAINAGFGQGSAFQYTLVLASADIAVADPRFIAAAQRLERTLESDLGVRQVRSFWDTGSVELIGRDDRSALFLVVSRAEDFSAAEAYTARLRQLARGAVGEGFSVKVTGTVAMLHDLNQSSSADLLEAEKIGIPLTLLILLIAFRSPLAALLPLVIAVVSVTVAAAGLYLLSMSMTVSAFAQNVVSMIGLGVGVDYSLFTVGRFRQALAQGATPDEAAQEAATEVGRALRVSGITVAIGFLALFLVNAEFLRSLALGGALVVMACLAATATLLPVLLSLLGRRLDWPFASAQSGPRTDQGAASWARWARAIMRRPWWFILPTLLLLAITIAPVTRLQVWNIGAADLDATTEARQGYAELERGFAPGWMGPVILLVDGASGSLWDRGAQDAVRATATRLGADPRIVSVMGYPTILTASRAAGLDTGDPTALPEALRELAADSVSADGSRALLVLVTRQAPESAEVKALVAALTQERWPEAVAAGLTVRVGGATASVADFDREMLAGTWRVIPAVLALTFVVLMLQFKSLVIPLKATLLNLASVLAAYGFLIYVFQDGLGAQVIGLAPPGGLISFVVLMLFTVLFGLSMDYEVFLLTHICDEHRRGADDTSAVATGLQRTAGLITSAALIMVCLFGSFGFTGLVATREFGLGLAFAVLFDATLIRVLLVPALMALFGAANWWQPRWLRGGA